jgi:hypothetical protein
MQASPRENVVVRDQADVYLQMEYVNLYTGEAQEQGVGVQRRLSNSPNKYRVVLRVPFDPTVPPRSPNELIGAIPEFMHIYCYCSEDAMHPNLDFRSIILDKSLLSACGHAFGRVDRALPPSRRLSEYQLEFIPTFVYNRNGTVSSPSCYVVSLPGVSHSNVNLLPRSEGSRPYFRFEQGRTDIGHELVCSECAAPRPHFAASVGATTRAFCSQECCDAHWE